MKTQLKKLRVLKPSFIFLYLILSIGIQTEAASQSNEILKAKMERDYQRILKTLTKAEQIKNNGGVMDIEMVTKKLEKLKAKFPDLDTSEADEKVASFNANTFDYEDWKKKKKIISKYYDKSHVVNVRSMFFNSKLVEDASNFDLEYVKKTLSDKKEKGTYSKEDEELENIITDYPLFIADINLAAEFLQRLDKAAGRGDVRNPVVTLERAKAIKQEAEAVFAFAGPNNPDIQSIIDAASNSIKDAESALESVYTSDFHKAHLGEIVFSKKPLVIGSEKESDIVTKFKTGDAIYGTVYLGRTIGDMIGNDAFNTIGATGFTLVLNLNSIFGHMEKWEVDSFAFHHHVSVSVNHLKDTYIQIVLLPENPSVLKDKRYEYTERKNYTPVIFARGLRAKSKRNLPIEAYFTAGDRSGFNQKFEGKFEIDLSHGEGPDYYKEIENRLIDKYIEDNEIPKAVTSNPSLEQQFLDEMNSKGWRENFVKAVIASQWMEEIVPGGKKQRTIEVYMVAEHPDGYCFYHQYDFVSFPSGSGWTKPQYHASGTRTRVLCSKVKK
ncbi:hypothetical protein [Winogradskyella flava]|uniref:hypothetical protein n=1 Tax=Winogradskyella flava TaxID=1884876 RepID=UPI00249217EB|nr:hypothetical protein [Winogradskyella flava]